jgi:hypothetical protein
MLINSVAGAGASATVVLVEDRQQAKGRVLYCTVACYIHVCLVSFVVQ